MILDGLGSFDYRDLTYEQAKEFDRHCDKWLASRGIKMHFGSIDFRSEENISHHQREKRTWAKPPLPES